MIGGRGEGEMFGERIGQEGSMLGCRALDCGRQHVQMAGMSKISSRSAHSSRSQRLLP